MVGSEFDIQNMKAWIILPCLNGSGCWWWCNGVGDIFLAHLVQIEHRLNATVYLSIVADHVHAVMTTVYLLLMYFQQDNASSQSSNHLRLVSWTWRWVHFTQMTSTVTRSQSNRAALGCGGTRDSHHGCAADKSAATVMLSWQYGPKSLRNVSNTLLNLCHKELRQFWRQNRVQPGTSKVYLIKWPVSVCLLQSF